MDVLYIDDNDGARRLILETLPHAGISCVAIERPADIAATIAEYGKPRLILLDVMMPGKDGFDVRKALKADPSTSAIPVAYYSVLPLTELTAGEVMIDKSQPLAAVVARVRELMA